VAAGRRARLDAPAGLDLGAITPDEIAISLLAAAHRAAGPTGPLDKFRQIRLLMTGA
jgi:xanthine/CO dehydrogenase XdhC/CoxF family maturation factor